MTGSVPFKLYRPLALNASGAGVAAQTIAGTLTMVASDDQFQRIDGGASNRDVTLPVAAPELKGCFFVINNVGTTNSLVLKNGGSTIATLNFGEQGMAACNGTDWLVLLTTSSTATDIFAANGAYTGNNTHSGTETFSNAAGVSTDVITERSAGVGVTIDGALIKDSHILDSVGFYDAAAPTKIARIDAGGVTAGQTRVLAAPDSNGTLAVLGLAQSWTATQSLAGVNVANTLTLSDGSLVQRVGAGTGTGDLIEITGPDATHGWATYSYEDTVSPAAIETALFTVPAESVIVAVQANIATALTGGGTTVTASVGITGDVDAYGTFGAPTDVLTQNGKLNYAGAGNPPGAGALIGTFQKASQALKLIGAATGGATAGNTALTLGSVKVRVIYKTLLPMVNQ